MCYCFPLYAFSLLNKMWLYQTHKTDLTLSSVQEERNKQVKKWHVNSIEHYFLSFVTITVSLFYSTQNDSHLSF